QQFIVAVRHAAALARPSLQMLELYAEHRALNAFHAVVEADFVVIVTLRGAVFSQRPGARGERGVVGHQGSAFATSAEVFAGIKTEAGHRAECADSLAAVFGSVGLAGVL